MKNKLFLGSLFIVAALVFSLGFAYTDQTEWGELVSLGQGQAQTFFTLDDTGKPEAVGIVLTSGALEGLPNQMSAIHLPLPDSAQNTVFEQVTVDWNPGGHEPPGVYDTPHFDFHFYLVSEEETALIEPGECTTAENSQIPDPPGMVPVSCEDLALAMKPLPADMAPPDAQLLPAVVPQMGNHLMDLTAPEFNGQPFTYTWIYGVFDGEITFLEPMATKKFLENNPDVSQPLKVPQAMPEAGWYPTEFAIHHLADSDSLVISLEAFKWFEASTG